jgi:hypothetical protein
MNNKIRDKISDILAENTNAFIYIPSIIITILNCLYQDKWYLLVMILPITVGWSFIPFLLILIIEHTKPLFDKECVTEIINELNIDRRKWENSSRAEKQKLYFYFLNQKRVINDTADELFDEESNKIQNSSTSDWLKFYKNTTEIRNNIMAEVSMKWKGLSLNERIELIEDHTIKRMKYWEEKSIKEKRLKIEREKEKILKEEQEKIRLEEEKRKDNEELAKRKKIEKDELLRITQIRKQEELEKLAKKRDEEYKERIKIDILEKERRKQLESDAIQELIDNGNLSNNFSIKNIRVPIPSHIMQAVWKRDMQCCVNCGSNQNLEYDHIIPVSKGGSNSINNIQLLCQKCNRTKSSKIM